MGKLPLELTNEPIVGNAGLAAVGELMRISDIDSVCVKRESANLQVAEKDILRCLGGLIAIGKVGFDHVRQFKDTPFFATALGMGRVSEADILRLYRDRGTCEQYFAEIKSELDLERLPSGKFSVNELYFGICILVNNMLRVIGEALLDTGLIGLKKATRRRLRTIMQGMMYLCGRLVRHARSTVLKVVSNGGFGEALVGLHSRLATV